MTPIILLYKMMRLTKLFCKLTVSEESHYFSRGVGVRGISNDLATVIDSLRGVVCVWVVTVTKPERAAGTRVLSVSGGTRGVSSQNKNNC